MRELITGLHVRGRQQRCDRARPRRLGLATAGPRLRRRRDVQHRLQRQFLANQEVTQQADEKEDNAADKNRGNALVDLHAVHAA